jgi:hypothetical protein
MKKTHKLLLLILLPAIITAFIWTILSVKKADLKATDDSFEIERPESGKKSTPADQRNDLRQNLTQAKINQLEQRISDLEQQFDSSNDEQDSDNNINSSHHGPLDFLDRNREKQKEIRQKREEAVERIFASNKHDYEWENETQKQIRDLLAGDQFSSSSVNDMDCRYNLCKLTFSHKDEQTRNTFAEDFGLKAPQNSHIWGRPYYDENKGGYGTVLYLARKGYSVF